MAEDSKPPKPYIPPEPDEATRLYWDRLDAKFANLNAPPKAPSPAAPAAPVASAPIPAEPAAPAGPPSASPSAPASGLIAEAFGALLALEDGQPGAKPVRLTTGNDQPPPAAEPTITDAVIEDVVRRVIERLAPDAVRAVVVDVVSHISERLVKEEIDRIRKQHA
jgi:hypothetical protein